MWVSEWDRQNAGKRVGQMDVMQIDYSAQSAHSLLPSNWPGHYLMSPSIKPADAFVRTFARLPCRLQMSMSDVVVRLFVHNVPIQDPSSPQRIRFSALGALLARGPHGQRTSAGGTEAALIKVGHQPSAKRPMFDSLILCPRGGMK